MANYDIKALHNCILKTLQTIDKVCKEHNLRYYIWAGTQLGAVRHGGFIPWDDDIDIAMPRKDYDLLIANAKEWLPNPYEMVCAENDENYPIAFAKIQDGSTTIIERMHLRYLGGAYIDVFPLDGVPNNWRKRWHFARYKFYRTVLYLVQRDPYKHGKGPSSWAPLLCRKLFTLKGVQKSIRNILTKYDFDNSTLVADYDDGLRFVMPKEILGTPIPCKFEDIEVLGVAQPDAYLKMKYGNYMQLPPEDKRRQHNFHYLDLEHSYREMDQNKQ